MKKKRWKKPLFRLTLSANSGTFSLETPPKRGVEMNDTSNLTKSMSIVLREAKDRAISLNHIWISSEHLLYGLIKPGGSGDSIAIQVLSSNGIDPDMIWAKLDRLMQPGRVSSEQNEIDFSSAAGKILSQASAYAEKWKQDLHTGHLLVSLLEDRVGAAANVLHYAGLTYDYLDDIREEVSNADPRIEN
jgi:ATP-dependent Clp protease ATP-binding subunit ClpA